MKDFMNENKMSDPEKKPQSTGELTNSELEGVQGGMMIPAGTRFLNSLSLKIAPSLTKTAEAADQNSDQSPLF